MALPHCILQGCAVLIFSSDGKMKTKFGSRGSESGQFAGPHYVTANSHGNIIVSDFHNHTVKVSCRTQTLCTIGSQLYNHLNFDHHSIHQVLCNPPSLSVMAHCKVVYHFHVNVISSFSL